MSAPNKVEIFNTATKRYGVVPRFIFEHPVYGAHMVKAEEADKPTPEAPAEEEPKPDPKPAKGEAKGNKSKNEGE